MVLRLMIELPFDQNNNDGIREWQSFFSKYFIYNRNYAILAVVPVFFTEHSDYL